MVQNSEILMGKITYLKNDAKQYDTDEHQNKGVNKPSQPVHTIAKTHDLHDFL